MLINNIKGKKRKKEFLEILGEEVDRGVVMHTYTDTFDKKIHCFAQYDIEENKLYELMYVDEKLETKKEVLINEMIAGVKNKYKVLTTLIRNETKRYGFVEDIK